MVKQKNCWPRLVVTALGGGMRGSESLAFRFPYILLCHDPAQAKLPASNRETERDGDQAILSFFAVFMLPLLLSNVVSQYDLWIVRKIN
jgi:hypothetical protein